MRYDSRNAAMISHLHPAVQHKAWQAIEELVFVGEDALFAEGLRTIDEQDDLFAQGRWTPGPVVTDARGGWSFHNYGLAFDLVPVGPLGVPMDQKHRLEWAAIGRYDTYGRILQGIGLSWGFQMWGFDRPHFQYTTTADGTQLTIAQVRAGMRPDTERARLERRASLEDRLEIARKALPKRYISAKRRRALERYIRLAEDRLAVI